MSEPITNVEDAVAALGALPMPMGTEPRTLDQVEHELTGANLSLYEEELENARLRLALKSAQRGRRTLRSRVAELEAERHTTNEALDDAVRALRERGEAETAAGCPRNVIDGDVGGHFFKHGAIIDGPRRCTYCGQAEPQTGGAR